MELSEKVARSSLGPGDQADGDEELRVVLRGLRLLPESDRAALLMRAEEGISYQEIAAALNLSLVLLGHKQIKFV